MIIFFDLDGTLIDSKARHAILLDDLLNNKKYKIKLDVSGFLEYKISGKNTLSYLTDVIKINNLEAQTIFEEWKEKIETEPYIRYDVLYDDVHSTLSKIYQKNSIYFITARNNKQLLLKQLENLDIKKYAKEVFVVSPKNAYPEKLKIIKSFENDDIIIIGDTEVEYNVAISLGIKYIILNRGFRNKKYWDNKTISYDNLKKLEDLIN